MVLIDKLRIHTVDELCLCLDKVPTLGWKKLMHKGLNRIYENDDIRFIDSSKQLLDDLKGRGKSVEDLMDALSRIGNEKAVTIILQGNLHFVQHAACHRFGLQHDRKRIT